MRTSCRLGCCTGREDTANEQDRARFEAEAALIAGRTCRVRRVTPHLAEADEVPPIALPILPITDDSAESFPRLRGSQARGLLLQKLLEEVLSGETEENALPDRALALIDQLDAPGIATVDPAEAAVAVWRALHLPEIHAVRSRLAPECTVAASRSVDGAEQLTFGIADALALDADGAPELAVDWKSDVDPDRATVGHYHAQLRTYLQATGAKAGLLVFLTSGR